MAETNGQARQTDTETAEAIEAASYHTFISHRGNDVAIADAVRRSLTDWGVKTQDIFQYSWAKSGLQVGGPLTDQLVHELKSAKLIILVYTLSDEDWSFCMWECGVAFDKVPQNSKRIVVLQCGGDEPRLFRGDVLVKVQDQKSLAQFVRQAHLNENFWKDQPSLRGDLDEETLASRFEKFRQNLSAALPKAQEEVIPRWDYFTLSLGKQYIDKINALKLAEDDVTLRKQVVQTEQRQDERGPEGENAFDILTKGCIVVDKFGSALQHFDLQEVTPGLTWGEMIERWKGTVKNVAEASDEWIEGMMRQLWRVVTSRPSEARMDLMYSKYLGAEWRGYNVVHQARRRSDESIEFDVVVYRVPV